MPVHFWKLILYERKYLKKKGGGGEGDGEGEGGSKREK